ncbi:MAG: Gfo/Idh/MocA family oxidoreductase [Chloroflexi bacterium]|nr:Gfo/Idh/MocA family oxidoreductase [Chloroflexota bacterium]MCY3937288.1 Gfo/Idh/MocA family oxidoreductase [Chloroflexota bacterium]
MSAKIKVGVVGCGTVAELYYLAGIRNHSTADLTAVCDVVSDRAEQAARKYGASSWFSDLDRMLAEADLDAVLVLTQHKHHYENAMKVLKAGKHLAIEKPLAESFDQARQIVELAETSGLKLSAAPPSVLDPVTVRIRELIRDGAVGKISHVIWHASGSGPARRANWGFTDQTWFYQRHAGPMSSLGPYALTSLTWFLGPVLRVAALSGISISERIAAAGPTEGRPFATTAPDNNLVLLDWGEGTFGSLDVGYCAVASKGPQGQFFGDEGVLAVNGGTGADCIEVYRQDEGSGVSGWLAAGSPNLGGGFTIATTITHLVDCIFEDRQPETSGRHALHVSEIMETAARSADSGVFLETTTRI